MCRVLRFSEDKIDSPVQITKVTIHKIYAWALLFCYGQYVLTCSSHRNGPVVNT